MSAEERQMSHDGCAIVTGAARGIGAATATALASAGRPVLINYRSDADRARPQQRGLSNRGGFHRQQLQLCDPDHARP